MQQKSTPEGADQLFHSFTLSLFHSFTLSFFHSFTLSPFYRCALAGEEFRFFGME
jgi:hypothetical protein